MSELSRGKRIAILKGRRTYLRRKLEECRRSGRPYSYFVDEIAALDWAIEVAQAVSAAEDGSRNALAQDGARVERALRALTEGGDAMRKRYRFYACPADGCPKISGTAGKTCPAHEREMTEVILRREDGQDDAIRMERAAARVAEAGKKVGESGGKVADPFGMGAMFRRMAEDIESGRKLRDAPERDDEEDEDEDDDDE